MTSPAFDDIAVRCLGRIMRGMYDPKHQWSGLAKAMEPRALQSRAACLVPGCACKDARIVSHRRAAFFAAVARTHGETADRMIAPDPDWHLPLLVA